METQLPRSLARIEFPPTVFSTCLRPTLFSRRGCERCCHDFLSVTCADGDCFHSVSKRQRPMFSLVAVVRDAISAYGLWEQPPLGRPWPVQAPQPRLRLKFREGQSNWIVSLLVTRQGNLSSSIWECNREDPPVMSPVIQATGWRIVLTWVMAPLALPLHAYWETSGFPWLRIFAGSAGRQVGGPFEHVRSSSSIRECAIVKFRQ